MISQFENKQNGEAKQSESDKESSQGKKRRYSTDSSDEEKEPPKQIRNYNRPSGLELGYRVKEISGATEHRGQIFYIVSFEEDEELDLISAIDAKDKW